MSPAQDTPNPSVLHEPRPAVDEDDFAGFGGEAGGGAQAEGAREAIDGIGRRVGDMGFAVSQLVAQT